MELFFRCPQDISSFQAEPVVNRSRKKWLSPVVPTRNLALIFSAFSGHQEEDKRIGEEEKRREKKGRVRESGQQWAFLVRLSRCDEDKNCASHLEVSIGTFAHHGRRTNHLICGVQPLVNLLN